MADPTAKLFDAYNLVDVLRPGLLARRGGLLRAA